MKLSDKTERFFNQINTSTKLGDLRKMAKEIKKDHEMAMELWSTGEFLPRQLAILIMDKKKLTAEVIKKIDADIQTHDSNEANQLIDWLMANQLTKDKKLLEMIDGWRTSKSYLQRRIFWYHQGRLRWVGQTPPPNTEELMLFLEKDIEQEHPDVQWAMNFTAGQIGVFEPQFRNRCIKLGERTGLYRDEMVAKNCTPSYLPKFIAIQAAKLNR